MADPLDRILGPAPAPNDRHRYAFTQELLPHWFFRDAPYLLRDDDEDALTAELQDVLFAAGAPDEEELDALRVERVDVAGRSAILVWLPAPRFPFEAHFALLVDAPSGPCMLTLERTHDPEGTIGTMLCEQDGTGRRSLAGHGVVPTREAFLAAAAARL